MNLLIVEDEIVIARRLQRLCPDILGTRLHELRHAADLDAAQTAVREQRPDLVLLDLNLRGQSGFDLLAQWVADSFQTIIVSAHREQALKAFEYGVLDFVPKPFNRERLAQALERFWDRAAPAGAAPKLAVKQSGCIELIALDTIHFIRGADNYAELVLRDGRCLLHQKSLARLAQVLPTDWQRVHKSYLVDTAQVKAWLRHPGSKYELELHDGTRIPVSRSRFKQLSAAWIE